MQTIERLLTSALAIDDEQKKELASHPIFNYYQHLDTIETRFADLQICKHRKKIGSLFLENKYKSIVRNLLDFIIEIDLNKKQSYKNKFNKLVKKIIEDYENEFETSLKLLYGAGKGAVIYRIVYWGSYNEDEKTQGFKKMHEKQINFIKCFINNQNESNFNNAFKILTFFDLCLSAYTLAFYHIENRLANINGLLTKQLETLNF